MSPHLHRLCVKRADYRAKFFGLAEPEKKKPKPPCKFFGELVRLETCELGCKKGTKIRVVRCEKPLLKGQSVSAIPYKQDQADGTCKGCDGYEAHESSPSPPKPNDLRPKP
jgi:hypothetical protein